jgi:hypothetical protein
MTASGNAATEMLDSGPDQAVTVEVLAVPRRFE